ncbi:hypothetical protein BT69DRAFT_1213770, partial [Atractiella rhizophila]
MDTKACAPCSSNPSHHDDPDNLSEADGAFSANPQRLRPSIESVVVQNLSVLQLYCQPSPFLSANPTIFAPQFRFLSRNITPIISRDVTATPFSSHVSSSVQPVKIFKVSENIKKANPLGLRILCIDNGGIRTFSSPYMLEPIMLQAAQLLNAQDDEELRPCDVFDLICGASTGGWIALMLGRLGMTVRQCIAAYEEIRRSVF